MNTVACPGSTTSITPAHMHISWLTLFKAGTFAIKTVGEPGVHGATVTGMQGIGVKTPGAASVAEATSGLAISMHIPNDIRLTKGSATMIFAPGGAELTRFT